MLPSSVDPLFRRKNGKYRADPALIYPPFLEVICTVLSRCMVRGAHYYATSGFRSYEEQEKRHKAYKAGTGTRASEAGRSAHQYGCAIDFAPDGDLDTPGLQAKWAKSYYEVLIEECEREGLVNGHTFNDAPHCQIPRFVKGSSMRPLRRIYLQSRDDGLTTEESLKQVWNFLDSMPVIEPTWKGIPYV